MQIKPFQTDLKKIITLIQETLGIDAAIFDLDARIITCTDEYLRQKGRAVHKPSIEEVIANENVVVNKPGHMTSCAGCRFIGNCPAKIELLKSIRKDKVLYGVLAFTSFTDTGHQEILKNTSAYIEILNTFTDWIAHLISDKINAAELKQTRDILNGLMEQSSESLLVINAKGNVFMCNPQAENLFSFCDLYTRSAYHILPDAIVDKALEGNRLMNLRVKINTRLAYLSSKPVFKNNEVTFCLISIIEKQSARQSLAGTDALGIKKQKTISSPYFSAILGDSPPMQKIKSTVLKIRNSHSTVLISGETGTGKGLLAKAIHESNHRTEGPFVTLNCTSIPETLFESELFGYEEGAFTGAKKGGKPGRLELARGGTLFLDEIGEMPPHMQVKLLNVLQDYEFQRVGGVTPISIDTRVIAATNQDLDAMMEEKKFRQDLFYRLNVIPIHLPPLSERQDDIEMITQSFLSEANHKAGKKISNICDEVIKLFYAYPWPGNIRELQNIIEYCVNLEQTDTISVTSLPERFLSRAKPRLPRTENPAKTNMQATILDAQARTIKDCLSRFGDDLKGKQLTAEELGISLRTLYRKLEKGRLSSG